MMLEWKIHDTTKPWFCGYMACALASIQDQRGGRAGSQQPILEAIQWMPYEENAHRHEESLGLGSLSAQRADQSDAESGAFRHSPG